MKKVILGLVAFSVLFFTLVTMAATPPPAGYPTVEGLVRRVDLSNGKISIKHDEIPNLNMPPMTMNFSVADLGFLTLVSKDDKILFVADDVGGALTVLWLEKR